jgi:hypothetical protein
MRRIGLILIFTVCMAGPAAAWGDLGHRIVCEIAFRLAQPEVRAEIRRLIQQDRQFDFFRDSCTFPDHPRTRDTEHYVNLSRDAKGISSGTCPLAPKCVISAIKNDMDVLSSTASDEKKLAALKYLGHWVGDLHQPLHVSFEDDRGGNQIDVSGVCSANLHATWDTCLVIKSAGDDPMAAATELVRGITPVLQELWTQASDPRDWANESFAITTAAATRYCIRQGTSCALPNGEVTVDEAYVQSNRAIIREQLAKAGVRLAHLLNKALQP